MTARLATRLGRYGTAQASSAGAFDPLAARLVEEAGFPAVYMTGFGASAALLGRPDVGLLTMTGRIPAQAARAARSLRPQPAALLYDGRSGHLLILTCHKA